MGIQLINTNSEIGAGTRGSGIGIEAVKIASLNKGSNYFKKYPLKKVEDNNQLLFEEITTPFAKHIRGIREVYERHAQAVQETIKAGDFPLVLSADHATAGGTIAGIKAAYPNERLGVIWVDAHADLHSPYTSPSGNVHGMPLATALAKDNLEEQINDVTGEAREEWEIIKSVGGITPKIAPEDLIFFGVRDAEQPELNLMARENIKNYTVEEVRYRSLTVCLNEAIDKLKACDRLYISFDVDSMDCDLISKGTGTPVSKGFDEKEVLDIMTGLIATGKLCCFELVEVNPTLDNKGNKMAETAFDILKVVTSKIENTL